MTLSNDSEPAYDDLLQEARRLRSMHEDDDPTPMYVEQLFLAARQQDAFVPPSLEKGDS